MEMIHNLTNSEVWITISKPCLTFIASEYLSRVNSDLKNLRDSNSQTQRCFKEKSSNQCNLHSYHTYANERNKISNRFPLLKEYEKNQMTNTFQSNNSKRTLYKSTSNRINKKRVLTQCTSLHSSNSRSAGRKRPFVPSSNRQAKDSIKQDIYVLSKEYFDREKEVSNL